MSDIIDIILRIKDQGTGTIKEVSTALQKLDSDSQSVTSRGLTGLQKMLSIGIVGAVGAATVALGGLGAAIGSSVGKAAAMEQGVANIAATMLLTAEETTKVKGLIEDLGLDPKLKVTATEAAAAIEVLGTAGLSVTEILDGAARSTVLLANSTGADFAQAGAIAADVMAQFNIEAKDMAMAVDQITGMTVASKFGINDYALALSQAGGVASSVGVDFADFNAAIAAISPLFASGSDAGTSFKTFLTSLIPKSDEAEDSMRALGLITTNYEKAAAWLSQRLHKDVEPSVQGVSAAIRSYIIESGIAEEGTTKFEKEVAKLYNQFGENQFFEANGDLKDMTEVTRILTEATAGLTEEEKNKQMAIIFGSDAMRAAFGLIKAGVPGIQEMKDVIGNTSAEESAAIRMDTFAGALEIAQGIIDAISMSIGDKFLPVLRPLIERFIELAEEHGPKVIDFFGMIADKLNALIQLFLPAPEQVDDVSDALTGFGAATQEVEKILDVFGITADGVNRTMDMMGVSSDDINRALGMLGVSVEETGNGFFSFLNPVKAVIGSVVDAITQFFSWKDILAAIAYVLSTIALPAIGSFLAAISPAVAVFAGLVTASATLRNAWENDWGGIRTALTRAWEIISNVFKELGDANKTLGEKLTLVWNGIKEAAVVAWETIVTSVQEQWPRFVETVTRWGQAAWEWIQTAIPIALEKIGEWSRSVIGWIGENLPTWLQTLLQWGTALYQWIGEAIPKAINGLTDYIRGIREKGDKEGTNAFGSMVGQWATTLWEWIRDDLIPKVGPAFLEFIRAMLDYGAKLLESLGNLAVELGRTLWDWIVDVTPTAVSKLREWAGKLWDWIKTNAPTWGQRLGEWARIAWEWIKEATPKALEKLGEWAGKLWQWIKENWPKWRDKLLEWGEVAWTWITTVAIPMALEKLGEWWTKIKEWAEENFPKWRDKLLEWGKAAWEWITEVAIPEARKKLEEWFGELKDWLTENWPKWRDNVIQKGKDFMEWLRNGIDDGIATLQNWLRKQGVLGGIINDMIGATGAGGDGYTVLHRKGEEIVIGVADGMDSRVQDLLRQGWHMGEATQKGLQQNLDMHSPSRVMWGYGQDIATGLAMGIHDGQVYVKKTLEDMSVVWENTTTGRWIDFFSETGQKMARGLGNGLKSEAQYVADQIELTMKLSNDRIKAEVDSLTNSLTAKMERLKGAMVQTKVDIDALLKQAVPDNMTVIGVVPGTNGGTAIYGPAPTNNTPKPIRSSEQPSNITNFVPEVKEITTLGEALGLDEVKATASGESVSLLGGITLTAVDLKEAKENTTKAIEQSSKVLLDFIGGFTDFLKETLESSDAVFRRDKYLQEKALREGGADGFQEYLRSETHKTIEGLKSVYTGIKNSIANILGVNPRDLNVTGADSLRLIDRVKDVLAGTNINTNMEFIGNLLQELVNFRSLANTVGNNPYYNNPLPTDARLTGGNVTNNYEINLVGSGNASADLVSTVQLLQQLGSTAIP